MHAKLESSISDTSLRRRLIIGSLSLAVAVSIIFIIVAYRLTSDLAYSIEVKTLKDQFERVFNDIEGLSQDQKTAEGLVSAIQRNPFYQLLEPEVVAFELQSSGHSVLIKNAIDIRLVREQMSQQSRQTYLDGTIELDGQNLFWQFKSNQDHSLSLLMVSKTISLDESLDYIVNRLSITSFLTFWLAVWAALTMSSIITKRFEDNNQKLAFLAMHDPLTGLKNRTYLNEYFSAYLTQTDSKGHAPQILSGSLLMIDLNKFKDVNDAFGHAVGDEFLKKLAAQLQDVVGEEHQLVRYGGDEFVVWLDSDDLQIVMPIVDEILKCCGRQIEVAGMLFDIGASVGIVRYPEDGVELDTLLKHADIAMYQAKKLRKGAEFYRKQLPEFSERQVVLRGQLSQAIALKQFVLLYQPKVSLPDGKLLGVEALARWQHPEDGMLSPDAFIELIEQGGIIHSFSRLVIQQAVQQISVWMKAGQRIPVSINLSAYNLTDKELVGFIKQTLRQFKVPAELLEVELTESASMLDFDITQQAFRELHALGIKLAIDDFGTGMSSFAYLRELEVDFVKVDRSFVASMLDDRRNELVVKGLISMCHSLEKTVIAEGIETQQQAQKLFELGCTIGQGYYFAKPCFAKDISQFM